MAVQHDVYAQQNDNRSQDFGGHLQNRVVARLVEVIRVRRFLHRARQLAVFFALRVQTKQEKHHHRCRKEHRGFAQRIKRAVIQNHAGDDVDSARFLQALFDVAGGNLVVDRVIRAAKAGQIHHREHQQRDHRHADEHAQHAVHAAGNLAHVAAVPLAQARGDFLFLLPLALHADAAGDILFGLARFGRGFLRTHHVALQRVVFKVDDFGRAALELRKPFRRCHCPHLRFARSAFPAHGRGAPRCARRWRESS